MDKYQEALERAKKGLPIDEVFPELKESEDEKIRKEMIHWLKGFIGEEEGCGYTEDEIRERIAYLEKQKEQKFESTALQKAFTGSQIDYTLEEKCDASDYADAILPTSVTYGENEEEYKLHKIIEAAFIAGQKKERKPAEWSEEDVEVLETTIATIEKNIKKGSQITTRATPSGYINREDLIKKLKSLRPQPHWKPSEEQISALEYFIRSWGESGTMSPQNTILCAAKSLLNDLKKL